MKSYKIGIIGMGYVGLPLALALSEKFKIIGFDKSANRINSLKEFKDFNNEYSSYDIKSKRKSLKFTNSHNEINKCNVYIICVPTPLKKENKPDLSFLYQATKLLTNKIKKKDLIIYESTVYPGATEEIVAKIFKKRKLKINKDYYLGYSPERVNPGDKIHNIKNVTKVISGSNKIAINHLHKIYGSVIKKIFIAGSIKIAESAKIIENTQRDLNIALINELSILFNKMNIDFSEVLEAARTKWNFLDFKPGLVGGHCIGVDPYYLTYKSHKIGYTPRIILAGRKINDQMALYVVNKIKTQYSLNKIKLKNSNFLIIGLAFKENCSDLRNSQYLKIHKMLVNMGINVDLWDPLVQNSFCAKNFNFIDKPTFKYDGILISYKHRVMKNLNYRFVKKILKKNSFVFDLKNILKNRIVNFKL
jgi:UDP-N-acetyl-D-galactosamine dehydrogenase